MFRWPSVGYVLRPAICSTGSPSCSPRVFTVGPGDISAYGTGMKTPAHRSAISIRVEASIVAVRRGMGGQYGTCLSAHRQGRPSGRPCGVLRGPALSRRSAAGPGLLHRLPEAGVPDELRPVAARLARPAGL